jgi:hypothetical protein
VIEAEKLKLGPTDRAVFDEQAHGLKVIVNFHSREVHLVTAEAFGKEAS